LIEHLPPEEKEWLARFFARPNELSWFSLVDGSAPPREADQVRQWLALLAGSRQSVPIILPFFRGGKITGWYATTQGRSGGYELREEINGWLGPTWLSRFERVPTDTKDPMAAVLLGRFGGTVYRFTGADAVAMKAISARLCEFAEVEARRPQEKRTRVRPVGAIRSDFERAVLAGDISQAESTIGELKQTGRLNEENLRYLEVRLSAGLGLWPEIARDHWRIKTLADLALPPQVLSDLIEALYRTHIDPIEATGDAAAVRDAFARNIVEPYPKLFASRRGIRAPRVVKAFVLYEQFQRKPDHAIINELLSLLPAGTNASLFQALPSPELTSSSTTASSEADEAFDDGQFDRAFEFYLRLPHSRKTLSRLVSCVGTIGTDDARDRLLAFVDNVEPELIESLAQAVQTKIHSLAQERKIEALSCDIPERKYVNPWMRWAEQLQAGDNLSAAARNVQSAPTNWDATEVRQNAQLAKKFADILSGLDGEASAIARAAVPQIIASFFPDEIEPTSAAKPVASLLLLFIAIDEAISKTDLDLLAQLTLILIEQGLSSDEYVSLIGDLEDVQKRIGSYSYLSWSLDLSETLAILPCPSDAAHNARLRFFMQVLSQVNGFSHRLTAVDLLPLEMLAKDYGLADDAVAALNQFTASEDLDAKSTTDLSGKTIGIYTLAEAAGTRAKRALEDLFPGCRVVVNSDLVATAQLTSLAKTADIFVFAWKSSSHQAFYCVKDARAGNAPIWAPGKGTASIIRAIFDHID
jgi:hypothetical protein